MTEYTILDVNIPTEKYEELYSILKTLKIPKVVKGKYVTNSTALPKVSHTAIFGNIFQIRYGKVGLSAMSQKRPDVYEYLQNLMKEIYPDYKYSSIQVNHNVVCNPHRHHKANVGDSIILSVGNYTGCKFVIKTENQDEILDTYHQPILFDGVKNLHWNTDDLEGDKYSVVFFSITNYKIKNKA
jgi:hypothetical protein